MPPCLANADGLCKYTFEPPFQHTPETRLAWRIYKDVVALSGYDSRGLPTVDKMEVALAKWNLKMTRDEATSLIDMLITLNATLRNGLNAKMQQNNG